MLGNSLLKYNPDYRFVIGLVDQLDDSINYNDIPFEIIEVENIQIPNFNELILKYNITELNTAVKPFYFKYLFSKYNETTSIIYLDPDIEVFDKFEDLNAKLEINDIVLTPHIITPINDNLQPDENVFLNVGIYNLGFIALKNTTNSLNMLNWWSNRLLTKGYNNVAKGMFTDQLWINFVPLFYNNVSILKNPGYNVAYWNLHERIVTNNNSKYYVNDQPLVFYHYSGFNPLKPNILSKYQNRISLNNNKELNLLFKNYAEILLKNNYTVFTTKVCAYWGIKEKADEENVLKKVKSIPVFKRVIRKMILFIIKKLNIILDYNVFYQRES